MWLQCGYACLARPGGAKRPGCCRTAASFIIAVSGASPRYPRSEGHAIPRWSWDLGTWPVQFKPATSELARSRPRRRPENVSVELERSLSLYKGTTYKGTTIGRKASNPHRVGTESRTVPVPLPASHFVREPEVDEGDIDGSIPNLLLERVESIPVEEVVSIAMAEKMGMNSMA